MAEIKVLTLLEALRKPQEPRCADCIYSQPYHGTALLLCRREPQPPAGDRPRVAPTSWCGEGLFKTS